MIWSNFDRYQSREKLTIVDPDLSLVLPLVVLFVRRDLLGWRLGVVVPLYDPCDFTSSVVLEVGLLDLLKGFDLVLLYFI